MVEVLLVEDNAGDAILIRQILATDCPVPVNLHVAREAEQALVLLNAPDFKANLIILDLNLPKMSGTALLEVLGKRDIPILVFTTSLNKAEKQRVRALGVREFIQKPSDLDDFRDAVRGIIDRWVTPKTEGASNAE